MKHNLNTNDRQDDMELVRRAQQGDADAFSVMFGAHRAKIYSVCLRMTSNAAEAEDLTQDAFLQVFRRLGTFRGDAALSTWLCRVAVNTVLRHLRMREPRQLSLDQNEQWTNGSPKLELGRMDDRLAGSVDRIVLARAMKGLPVGYRTIFVLHEIKGYAHREIARMLQCSVGTSKSQLHKAKMKLKLAIMIKAVEQMRR